MSTDGDNSQPDCDLDEIMRAIERGTEMELGLTDKVLTKIMLRADNVIADIAAMREIQEGTGLQELAEVLKANPT